MSLEFKRAAAARNEPTNRSPTHRRLDQISGIAAGDDAPTCYGERIKIRPLDLGTRGCSRASSAFGAVTKQLLSKRRRPRLASGEIICRAATAGRGSGAHNICAGHGSSAPLLAADGGRQPSKKLAQVVIGDER